MNGTISLRDLKKDFRVYSDRPYELKDFLLFGKRKRYKTREVLKGIDLNIVKGEAVGLIGKNGCGKSTLLKLISRILYPNEGKVIVNGKVSALIELGAGFHPDMSGRENIYINASIFGFSRKEIDAAIEDIIAFSELGEDIDNPVRTYSTGMYMRLAFSVAINVHADILLIDEILSVGDIAFQEKCFQKLASIKEHGTTVVIVSHDLSSLIRICDRCIWINEGVVAADGDPQSVCDLYRNFMGGTK